MILYNILLQYNHDIEKNYDEVCRRRLLEIIYIHAKMFTGILLFL